MKRFLDRITPSFIHSINQRLLKNNILGWQLQLPLILWLWFLITLITLPIPFLYRYNVYSYSSDEFEIMLSCMFISILEFLLFGYILIQFNATKVIGNRVFLHGLKEQLGYFLVMCLCLVNVVLFPLILDYRKSHYMTEEEIHKEAIIFNKGRHYIMDTYNEFRYFPDDAHFLNFMEYAISPKARMRNRDEYYAEVVKPLLAPYFKNDPDLNVIDSQYTRATEKAPKLYYVGGDYLNEEREYGTSIARSSEGYQHQLIQKTDEEKLKDVTAFIELYKKYQNERKYYYDNLEFMPPETILSNYNSNQFRSAFFTTENRNINSYGISNVHSNVLRAKYRKWEDMGERAMVCFHVALVFAVLFFVFKNVRLREFILVFVYTGLLTLLVAIITLALRFDEFLPIHTPIVIFFMGVYFAYSAKDWKSFSHIKTIFVILTTFTFAYAPIYLLFYGWEYLDLWTNNYDCSLYPDLCDQYYYRKRLAESICLWGGPVLYLLIGSTLLKRSFEKIWALPLKN